MELPTNAREGPGSDAAAGDCQGAEKGDKDRVTVLAGGCLGRSGLRAHSGTGFAGLHEQDRGAGALAGVLAA